MYAVVEAGGKQFKVAEKDIILVPRVVKKEGAALELKKVLLVAKDGKVTVGNPYVSKASVATKVLGEAKGPKVVVFKMKRRKGYHKKQGHRQKYTRLQVEKIK